MFSASTAKTRVSPALFSSASDNWPTPQAFFDVLDAEFHFVLDVCASASNAKTVAHYALDHGDPARRDGLAESADWAAEAKRLGGAIWMNPPYGRTIGQWMAKAAETARAGATVVCLVPSRTGTRWFHDHVLDNDADVRFVKGRLKFGDAKNSAPFDSLVVIFRPPAAPAVDGAHESDDALAGKCSSDRAEMSRGLCVATHAVSTWSSVRSERNARPRLTKRGVGGSAANETVAPAVHSPTGVPGLNAGTSLSAGRGYCAMPGQPAGRRPTPAGECRQRQREAAPLRGHRFAECTGALDTPSAHLLRETEVLWCLRRTNAKREEGPWARTRQASGRASASGTWPVTWPRRSRQDCRRRIAWLWPRTSPAS